MEGFKRPEGREELTTHRGEDELGRRERAKSLGNPKQSYLDCRAGHRDMHAALHTMTRYL